MQSRVEVCDEDLHDGLWQIDHVGEFRSEIQHGGNQLADHVYSILRAVPGEGPRCEHRTTHSLERAQPKYSIQYSNGKTGELQ